MDVPSHRRPVTVAEYANRWFATHSAPPFIARYQRDIRQRYFARYVAPTLGHVRIDRVTPRRATELQRELFAQGLSRGTVEYALLSVGSTMFRDAGRDGVTKAMPFRGLRWPRKFRRKPDVFTDGEIEALLAYFQRYAGGRYRLYMELVAGTGARPSEIAGLQIRDWSAPKLSIERGLVRREETPGKTACAPRTIVLSPRLVELVEELRPRGPARGWLCVGHDGAPIDSTAWSGRRWGAALKACNLRRRSHYALRHSYISRALSAGATPLELAEYCGTSVEKVCRVYAAWIGGATTDPLTAARERRGG